MNAFLKIFLLFFQICKKHHNGFSRKRDICQKYWWQQDDFRAITWNVFTGYMTIYLYHNSKCDLAKALKCMEKLTKESEKSNQAATLDEWFQVWNGFWNKKIYGVWFLFNFIFIIFRLDKICIFIIVLWVKNDFQSV